jgi:hypothetical protein
LLQETENDRRVILKAYVMTGGWIGRMVDHRELPSIENQKNSLFDLFMQSSSIGGVTQAEFWDWIKIRETKLVSLLHVVTDLLPPLALIVSDFYFGNDFNVVWEKNTRDHQTQKSSKEPALIQTRVTSQTRTIIRNLMRDCVYDMRDG